MNEVPSDGALRRDQRIAACAEIISNRASCVSSYVAEGVLALCEGHPTFKVWLIIYVDAPVAQQIRIILPYKRIYVCVCNYLRSHRGRDY